MRGQGVSVPAIARHFGVDYHPAAKAVRWFQQRRSRSVGDVCVPEGRH